MPTLSVVFFNEDNFAILPYGQKLITKDQHTLGSSKVTLLFYSYR